MSKTALFIFLIITCGIGIFFRFWNQPYMAAFHGDQGIDLLVALRIVRGESFPLIGPFLSPGENFHNPPTYYYFLALLLKIFSSEQGVIYVFGVLGMLSGLLYASVIQKKEDAFTAIIFLFLYMILFSSVEQGRTFWNPYAATFFFALSFWLFLFPHKTFLKLKYILGVLSVSVGVTMYPTGFLLIPIYFAYGLLALGGISASFLKRITLNSICFVLSIGFFCFPFALYEAHHEYPTIRTVLFDQEIFRSAQFVIFDSINGFIRRAFRLEEGIYFLHIPRYFQSGFIQTHIGGITTAVIGSFVVMLFLYSQKGHREHFGDFLVRFRYKYLIIGLIAYLFLDSPVFSYRIIIFLPFTLFLLAYFIRRGIASKQWLLKIVTVFFLFLITYTNVSANIKNASYNNESSRYGHQADLYAHILSDMKKRHSEISQVDLHVISYRNLGNWEAMSLWYFFKKNHNASIEMNDKGNMMMLSTRVKANAHHAYLVCYSQFLEDEDCVKIFLLRNPGWKASEKMKLWPSSIYFMQRS